MQIQNIQNVINSNIAISTNLYNSLSAKSYYIKKLSSDNKNIISIDIIKDYIKISQDDISHDKNLEFFRQTAIEFAQRRLKSIISQTRYRMQIQDFSNNTENENIALYNQLSHNNLYGKKITVLSTRTVKSADGKTITTNPILMPLKPLINIENIVIDDIIQDKTSFIFSDIENLLYCERLNNDFSSAIIDFVCGYTNNDDIPQDIINAILTHIYFMWVENDFSISAPRSTIETYSLYQETTRKYRV